MNYKNIEHNIEEFSRFNWSDLKEDEGRFPIPNYSFWRDDDPFSLLNRQWYISVQNDETKEIHKWALPKELGRLFDKVYTTGCSQFREHLKELLGIK